MVDSRGPTLEAYNHRAIARQKSGGYIHRVIFDQARQEHISWDQQDGRYKVGSGRISRKLTPADTSLPPSALAAAELAARPRSV
jgi:hypothetical protein